MKLQLLLSLLFSTGLAFGAAVAPKAKKAAVQAAPITVTVSRPTGKGTVLKASFPMHINHVETLAALQKFKAIQDRLPGYVTADLEFADLIRESPSTRVEITVTALKRTFNADLCSLIFPATIEEILSIIAKAGFDGLYKYVDSVIRKSLDANEMKILKPTETAGGGQYGLFLNINGQHKDMRSYPSELTSIGAPIEPKAAQEQSAVVVTTCAGKTEVKKTIVPDGSRTYSLYRDEKLIGELSGYHLVVANHPPRFCINRWTVEKDYQGFGFEDQLMNEALRDLIPIYTKQCIDQLK